MVKQNTLISILLLLVVCGADYDYLNHGSDWETINQICGKLGSAQSPVDLKINTHSWPMQFQTPYFFPAYSASLIPSTISFDKKSLILKPTSFINPWGYVYTVSPWGESINVRSVDVRFRSEAEHTINGVRHPLEMQISHSHVYGVVSTNKTSISVLFSDLLESQNANPFLQKVIDAYVVGQTAPLSISLDEVLPKVQSIEAYYFYSGSLTQPMCTEKTMWLVFEQVREASADQIKFFYDLTHNNPEFIGDGNYRESYFIFVHNYSVQLMDTTARNIMVTYRPSITPENPNGKPI